ncbi:MAG: hypothetical protein AB7N24_19505 [Dehalococcoidia bacterium]
MTDDLGTRLSRVDEVPEPAAARFDLGRALSDELVVLPSAFNPPTLAHQHLLERALELAADASPVAMLTTRNVDKGLHGASLEQRVEMLLALQAAWPELAVLVSNQARIIDQAEALRRTFGDALRLRFVVGFDTLERLFARRYYSDMEAELTPFFERSRVLAANRADVGSDAVREWIERNAGPFSRAIDVMEIDEEPASMSSTAARERVPAGDGEMLPAGVQRYIERHGLYR